MLLTLFHYTQVYQPRHQADMETGDFDQTPAPSSRPSLATLRLEEGGHAYATTDASANRAAAPRHHLLKTSASGPTLVDGDLPAPPVVSRSPSIETPPQSGLLEDGGAVPPRPASALPRQSSPVRFPEKPAYSAPIQLVDRECVNPSLHEHDAQADVHHPGRLEAADFCDHGVRSAGSRSLISSSHPSSPISDVSMMSGEMHRLLSSGDISVTEVTVPIHRHKGHSIAVKVRPAFSYYPVHHPVIFGHHHGLEHSRSANKVQPFDPGAYHPDIATEQHGDGINGLEAAASGRTRREPGNQEDEAQGGVFPASKVGAFVPESRREDGHHYSSHKLKVRPYTGTDDDGASRRRRVEGSGQFDPDGNLQRQASNGSSARTHSLGSTLDYKRTAQWLREILKYPETYTSKFTELPPKSRPMRSSSAEQRRQSETALSSVIPSRRMTGLSSHSGRSEPKIDPLVFQRAVNDLEKLMNEAIALASEAARRPDTPPCPKRHQPSISLHSRCHSVPGGQDGASQGDGTSGCTHESPGSRYEEIDLHSASRQQQRPIYQHAATYTSAPERPRLNQIIQNYPNAGDDAAARGFPLRKGPSPPTAAEASLTVPGRRSSINGASNAAAGPRKASARAQKLKHKKPYDDLARGATDAPLQGKSWQGKPAPRSSHARHASHESGDDDPPRREAAGRRVHADHGVSLRRRSHVSLRGAQGFSLAKSRKRQPTARDWSPVRKRFVATVACVSTALVGVILGIYAGLVPSIQYYIIDQSHATVHGNTGCFLGLAIPTFFLWPLPLLHGRKPYITASLVLAMPLLFPQALAVNAQRLTHTGTWRAMLLASRTLMGGSLGFASMNFHSILTDLFGASLMSTNPHQEVVDHYDARRHGGGMGVWLGIWTWCWIGSLGIGFLVGACIIDRYPPTWGFYISIVMIAVVLFLNVLSPEVRRSAFRRSVAEVRTGADISRRVARGEIMMHRVKTGPKWWGQEVYHGILLTLEMLRQPGFLILAFYAAWIYAQVVLVIVLLGSLASKFYKLRSPNVGLLVGSVALGAILAIPFQKASFFSRSRQAQLNTNKATMERKIAWSSHLVRRTVFAILLPLAGVCYAAVSSGPPMHVGVPTIFAFCIGLLSCLAIAECNGLVMECFDTSDLSPGMTGRQRSKSGKSEKRTNYSSFPRVTAGFAAMHTLAFIFAAGATALGGLVTRTLGQQVATGVVAGILFILTAMLLLILARFTDVQIIPNSKVEEMDRLIEARRRSTIRRASMPDDRQAAVEEEKAWRPAMLGNPIGKKRRMNVFELGSKSRWQEIRKKNKLVDENTHLNQAAWNQGLEALDDKLSDIQSDVEDFFGLGSVKKRSSRRLRRSDETSESAQDIEMANMGNQASGSRPSLKRFVERECVMSQTVTEENEGLDEHQRHR
ncbi:major facilitator superfamily transporter [Trichoderma cornu-damae]|uniref:Major facilitator superfamily transporter n=1 Tax=Trichoderma cornu-damae TaxID=654480 RepID=A0A9P8QUH4_9HYPO|nr:major facilitator superfamily transporter [Trichoderma cornu-damae]